MFSRQPRNATRQESRFFSSGVRMETFSRYLSTDRFSIRGVTRSVELPARSSGFPISTGRRLSTAKHSDMIGLCLTGREYSTALHHCRAVAPIFVGFGSRARLRFPALSADCWALPRSISCNLENARRDGFTMDAVG